MPQPANHPGPAQPLEAAYRHCRQLAQSHYENFPVASRLLPAKSRDAIAVIYAFARTADDFADEGDRTPDERLALLDDYQRKLTQLAHGRSGDDPIFTALTDVIRQHQLPLQLFHDLLSAFRQDVSKRRYADFAEVLDYCRRSANPVGRLLLHLHDEASEENLQHSDHICSALQLINFLQDIEQDARENDRIYLPQDEMAVYGVKESDLAAARASDGLKQLLAQQRARTLTLLHRGAPLGSRLGGRFGLEIRLIIEGGNRVLERLCAHCDHPFARPRLRKSDYLTVLWRALQPQRHRRS
ncbi:MAG: squalene synthase HpnC [Pseudomonadota bacterium]